MKKIGVFLYLPLSFVTLMTLAGLIYFLPPDKQFSLFTLHFTTLDIFFPIVFLFLFSLMALLTRSRIHGILFALLVVIYLVFRLNNLTHPFFLVLLCALFLALELFFSHDAKRTAHKEPKKQQIKY